MKVTFPSHFSQNVLLGGQILLPHCCRLQMCVHTTICLMEALKDTLCYRSIMQQQWNEKSELRGLSWVLECLSSNITIWEIGLGICACSSSIGARNSPAGRWAVYTVRKKCGCCPVFLRTSKCIYMVNGPPKAPPFPHSYSILAFFSVSAAPIFCEEPSSHHAIMVLLSHAK